MSLNESEHPYSVIISDNFHFMDDDEPPRVYGRFKTVEEAVECCQHYVKSDLKDVYKPGMSYKDMYQQYVFFGDDPFVTGPNLKGVPFSGRAYALQCCHEMCGDESEQEPQVS